MYGGEESRRGKIAYLVPEQGVQYPGLSLRQGGDQSPLRCRFQSGAGVCRKRKIELTGFEPATSSSRTKRATSLRYSSLLKPRQLYI